MTKLYKEFYRECGIRRLQQMVTPLLTTLVELPRNSLIHYVAEGVEDADFDPSKLYYGPINKKVNVDYVETLSGTEGSPHRNTLILRDLTRDFHKKNRKFKYVKDAVLNTADENTVVILSYGYLEKLYRYVEIAMTPFHKWKNAQETLWGKVNSLATSTTRHQFIFVPVPKQLPSMQLLKLYVEKDSLTMLKIFDDDAKLFILEIWRWLERVLPASSPLNLLAPSSYARVNIVFTTTDGRSAVINLGYLNSWIKNKNKTESGSSDVNKGEIADMPISSEIEPQMMQKLFLKFMLELKSAVPDETDLVQNAEGSMTVPPIDPLDIDEELDEDDESPYSQAAPTDNKKIHQEVEKDILISNVYDETKGIGDFMADVESELEVLDTVTKKQLKEKGIHLDKKGEIAPLELEETILSLPEIQDEVYGYKDIETSLKAQITANADYGLLTATEYRKHLADIEKYKTLKDPYGSPLTITQKSVITADDLALDNEKSQIPDSKAVFDKSMLSSSLLSYDSDYVNKVLQKDMLSMLGGLQKSGIIIRRHEVEVKNSVMGSYENHILEFSPVDGKPSTIHMRVPRIQEDGTFTANSNKYSMRKQRVDLPIRKIDPMTVALTSYYGKTFVGLSQKKSDNSIEWIIRQLNLASMVDDHPLIKRIAPANVFDNNFPAPFIYGAMADHFKSILTVQVNLNFDYSDRATLVNAQLLPQLETDGKLLVGLTTGKNPIVVDMENIFHVYKNGNLVPIGDIYTVLGLDISAAPVDYSEVRIFSKAVPVGLVLGYQLGLKKLIKLLDVKYRIIEGRKNKALEPYEFAVSFADISYIFDRRNRVAAMIMAGFTDAAKIIKKFNSSEFNSPNVYLNVLENYGLTAIYFREMDLVQQLFVDPITRGVLEEMKEPVTYNGLLIRATELLQTYHHPDSQDTDFMRFRGYERLSGAMYKSMVVAIRQFRNKNISGRSKIEMSPYEVWQAVMKDSAIKIVEDINPIQNLKESEIVTYVGEGGRGKDSMNKASRAYHVKDMGVISEATVDSTDVGVSAYLSANPNLGNMRGLISKNKTMDPTNLLSTSAMLAPGATHDDPKRVMFISVQQSHTIATQGYRQPQYRTGYENVIGHRTTDMFATTAKQDGRVVSIDEKGIVVEYKDGSQKGVQLGRVYGRAEGSIYPHDIVTPMKAGSKFKKGEPISYNTGFFEEDFLHPGEIIMKSSMTVKTALFESNQTHEDSSSISREVSEKARAKTTKIKSFVVNFKQNVIDVLKPGGKVSPKDILLVIEDEITSMSNSFDDEELKKLRDLANQSPKSGYLGTIDKIEVYYHGEKRDMSASIKALADRSDRSISETCVSTGKEIVNGQVTSDYRVNGTPLAVDKAEIRFYITIETTAGVGDKGVFANQLKTVIGETLDYSVTTKSGVNIDAIFGYRSVSARTVLSPLLMGTSITLLKLIAQQAVKIHRKKS